MLTQAAHAAFRILLFRAGPQDFPYSAPLARALAALAVATAFVQNRLTLGDAQALVHAVASVAVVALYTRRLLVWRKLQNRLQQTLSSLYVTGALVTILLLAPLSELAPHILRIAQDPALARTEPLPPGPAFAVMLLTLWQFAVSANVYRHSLDAPPAGGILAALLGAIITMFVAGALAGLAAGAA